MRETTSTKAVLMDFSVAVCKLTVPYSWWNSLRTGFESPLGVKVLPPRADCRLKPLRNAAMTA